MNCKHVEELLPLYVGRDLEEERARLVTVHVQSCSGCARSAQEYGEANQLLQLFEPPPFSEATYTAVRSRVLREIERESSTPQSIFALAFLRRSFQPRVMWAVSTVVLLAVCLFAYYLVANRTIGEQSGPQRAQNGGEKTTPDKQTTASQNNNSGNDLRADSTDTGAVPPAPISKSPKSRLNLKTRTAWHPRRAGEAPAIPVRTAQNSPQPKGAGPSTSAAEETLRVEIQTSDQNIRIIWFSHPSTKEGSPTGSSKGI